MKRLSEGGLAELRTQLVDLLDRGWIQHSKAEHAVSVVFVRKPDGMCRICYDYQGLNAISRPAVEPLPHIDTLLDGTLGSCFFTKLYLASSYHQLLVWASDLGRRVSCSSWASSNGTWCPSGCKDCCLS